MDPQFDNWQPKDFIDEQAPDEVEDDPWTPQDNTHTDVWHYSVALTTTAKEPDQSEAAPVNAEPSSNDFADSNGNWSHTIDTNDSFLEEFDPEPIDYAESDEPEVLDEFDADLRETVFAIDQGTPAVNFLSLRINAFLANVPEISQEEIREITTTLSSFSAPKLRSWLAWLSGKRWTGHLLMEFFDFREEWDEQPSLWHGIHRRKRFGSYFPVYNKWFLSLDDSYQLVKEGLEKRFGDILYYEWSLDWFDLDDQTRASNGLYSLASFILYRSSLSVGEDWRYRPDLGFDFLNTELEMRRTLSFFDERVSEIVADSRVTVRDWFAHDLWLDIDEWEN